MDPLTRLQNWYLAQCDGDWEHSHGISIDTLDNPGWSLKISLIGTRCSDRSFTKYSVGDSDVDQSWCECWVADNHFEAAGGPLMLGDMIEHFLKWADAE